ncbi:MAG: DUF5719 family protein [Leucobacter sp.]
MSRKSRILRGSARAASGLLVVAVAAVAVVVLSSFELPEVGRKPLAITVDTTQNAHHSVVCGGPFTVLGADEDRPDAAIPVGAPTVALAGASESTRKLELAEGGDATPVVYEGLLGDPLGAAQIQKVDTEALRGTAASTCAEPLNEQWLLGGSTDVGVSTTLALGNAGSVPANVQITVYAEDGEVDAVETAGVIVASGSEQVVSLNGYAPVRERLAVRVVSTGAPVTASLGVGQTNGLEPFAVSWVTRQQQPETTLVVPGVANVSDFERGPGDAGQGDQYAVTVRALAPGDEEGTARVSSLDANGKRTELGEIPLVPGEVGEFLIDTWPKNANAAIIESDVPIVGSVLGSATEGEEHDYEWFTPADELAAGVQTAAPVVSGGELVLVNTGTANSEVQIVSTAKPDAQPKTLTVESGTAVVVADAPADALITASQPLFAGVRYVSGGDIAGYPTLAADPRDGTLTVFTR